MKPYIWLMLSLKMIKCYQIIAIFISWLKQEMGFTKMTDFHLILNFIENLFFLNSSTRYSLLSSHMKDAA